MNGVSKKRLFFVLSARKDLKTFPDEVQEEIGKSLHKAQWGGVPDSTKPMKGFAGVSVMEIVERYNTNTYRAVYTAKFEDAIYVLHCFQKKSKTGIATTRQDMELIESRLKFAQTLYRQFKEETGD